MPYPEYGRRAAADRAKAWTVHQADRLGISPEAIETAIKRGWLPDQLDKVQDPAELLLPPPERYVFGLKVVR